MLCRPHKNPRTPGPHHPCCAGPTGTPARQGRTSCAVQAPQETGSAPPRPRSCGSGARRQIAPSPVVGERRPEARGIGAPQVPEQVVPPASPPTPPPSRTGRVTLPPAAGEGSRVTHTGGSSLLLARAPPPTWRPPPPPPSVVVSTCPASVTPADCEETSPPWTAPLRPAQGERVWQFLPPARAGCHNNNNNNNNNLPYRTVPYPTLPYPTLPYPTVPYPTLPYPTLPYRTVPYPTLPYPTIPYRTLLYPTLPYPTVPYRTLLYPTLPYPNVPYPTVPQRTLPYRTLPYRTLPYPTLPYPTLPYRTAESPPANPRFFLEGAHEPRGRHRVFTAMPVEAPTGNPPPRGRVHTTTANPPPPHDPLTKGLRRGGLGI